MLDDWPLRIRYRKKIGRGSETIASGIVEQREIRSGRDYLSRGFAN